MNLSDAFADQATDRERVKVIEAEYTVESDGRKQNEPIIHLLCRDAEQNRRHITVEGFRPSFYISLDEFLDGDTAQDLATERRILGVEAPAPSAVASTLSEDGLDKLHNATQNFDTIHSVADTDIVRSLDGQPLVQIYVVEPNNVPNLRDFYDQTWEADVRFTNRFLISSGITLGAEIPAGAERVRYENWPGHSSGDSLIQEITPAEAPEVRPRMLTCDIEVATEGDGFPDAARAKKPVTAITATDNYTGEYRGWILRSAQWDFSENDEDLATVFEGKVAEEIGRTVDIEVFSEESNLLSSFNMFVRDREFDLYTGWNSNNFDYPYLIKRSYNLGAFSVRDWSPIEDGAMSVWPNGDDDVGYQMEGLVGFDMLEGFKKTQWQKLRSYSLDFVSERVLGQEEAKLDVDDLDDEWHHHPFKFMAYNVRDTSAVVGIEEEKGVIDLFDNMRNVTGATYRGAENNGSMIDTLFLRQASKERKALPTNEAPEEGNYHGAFVFDPVPGKHTNVIYPDLASLYPYIMWSLNMSPETLFASEEELREAGYTPEDAFTAYIDKRGFKTVPKGESVGSLDTDEYKGAVDEEDKLRTPPGMLEPQYDEIYFLKPDVKTGFIRKVIGKLVDMKYEYKGTDIYAAIKRVTNSVYGVLGDSASAGKGFRLFDWRIAEAITMAGRKIIQFTGDQYVRLINEYKDGAGAYLVGGDTDSVITSVPGADSYREALALAQRASEEFQPTETDDGLKPGLYDEFMEDEFNIIFGDDEHKMDVEIESLATGCFFVSDFNAENPEETGVKKRYAQDIIWEDSVDPEHPQADELSGTWTVNGPDVARLDITEEDGYYWDPNLGHAYEQEALGDRIEVKGFEYVRSDSATITQEAQYQMFEILLGSDGKKMEDTIAEYVSNLADDVLAGDVPNEKIGRPKGMSKPLDEYGRDDDGEPNITPSPAYRGAKYANTHFDWEEITPGSKPVRFYVEQVRSDDYPEIYEYQTENGWKYPKDSLEVEDSVDAIAVEEPERIPDDFELDREKHLEKGVQDKLDPILRTLGMQWEHVVGDGRQQSLESFM